MAHPHCLIGDLQNRGGIARYPTSPAPGVYGMPQSRTVYDWKHFGLYDFMVLGDEYTEEQKKSARVSARAFARRHPHSNLCTSTESEGVVIYREITGAT